MYCLFLVINYNDARRLNSTLQELPMSVAGKIAALFAALTRDELDAMPPAERQRFSDLCRHWHQLAEKPPPQNKTGVLVLLRRGDRSL
jgi:hypothetical protein